MGQKQFASSARVRRAGKSARHMPDDKIDFSDIPESSDAELKRAQRVGRSPKSPGRPKTGRAKRLIAIRIAPELLAELRKLAAKVNKPYQTLIHEMLQRASRAKVA